MFSHHHDPAPALFTVTKTRLRKLVVSLSEPRSNVVTSHAERRIQNITDGVHSVLQLAYRGPKRRVGIQSLPPEVLGRIFELGLGSPARPRCSQCVSDALYPSIDFELCTRCKTTFPALVSRVCWRWRSVALQHAALWADHVRITPAWTMEDVVEVLQRCKTLPLDVMLVHRKRCSLGQFKEFLRVIDALRDASVKRWRSLTITAADGESMWHILALIGAAKGPRLTGGPIYRPASLMPRLELLHVDNTHHLNHFTPESRLRIRSSVTIQAPALKSLCITDFPYVKIECAANQAELEVMHLSIMTMSFVDMCLSFGTTFRAMESLVLSHWDSKYHELGGVLLVPLLPALKSLRIDERTRSLPPPHILWYLAAPALESLQIVFGILPDTDPRVITAGLGGNMPEPRFPALRALKIGFRMWGCKQPLTMVPAHVAAIMRALPVVEHLTVHGDGAANDAFLRLVSAAHTLPPDVGSADAMLVLAGARRQRSKKLGNVWPPADPETTLWPALRKLAVGGAEIQKNRPEVMAALVGVRDACGVPLETVHLCKMQKTDFLKDLQRMVRMARAVVNCVEYAGHLPESDWAIDRWVL